MNFKGRARAIKFSPDGKYFAITNEKNVNIWKAPGHTREFAPFVLYFTAVGHHDAVTNVNWSPDSKYEKKKKTSNIMLLYKSIIDNSF